jgi:hypothetical protein
MAKGETQGLPQVAVAVRRRRLKCGHIELLRAKIAAIEEIEAEARFVRLALRNLKVAGTQLKDIAARSNGDVFDDEAFEALPDRLKQRILMRLDNIAKRMAAARDAAEGQDVRDPAFRCVRDYERCRQEAHTSQFWCHISMIVCLVRTLLPRGP